MRKTTYVMHAEISRAVSELRARLEVSQPELARTIDKHCGRSKNSGPMTHQQTISAWENGAGAPSPRHRRPGTEWRSPRSLPSTGTMFSPNYSVRPSRRGGRWRCRSDEWK